MRSTFNISFVCWVSKSNKLGYLAIKMTIINNGERIYITLGRKERVEGMLEVVKEFKELGEDAAELEEIGDTTLKLLINFWGGERLKKDK